MHEPSEEKFLPVVHEFEKKCHEFTKGKEMQTANSRIGG